jgi:hypothetical protein
MDMLKRLKKPVKKPKKKARAKTAPRRDVTKTMGANRNTRRMMKKLGYTE